MWFTLGVEREFVDNTLVPDVLVMRVRDHIHVSLGPNGASLSIRLGSIMFRVNNLMLRMM